MIYVFITSKLLNMPASKRISVDKNKGFNPTKYKGTSPPSYSKMKESAKMKPPKISNAIKRVLDKPVCLTTEDTNTDIADNATKMAKQ